MILLETAEYELVRPLITDCSAELSVFATLGCTNPGEVWVNDREQPTACVIRTTETTVVAGSVEDAGVLAQIRALLSDWEVVYPDSPAWETCTDKWHPNPWVRRYLRRRLTAHRLAYTDYAAHLPEGYELVPVTRELLEDKNIENPEPLRHWVDNWGRDNYFARGAGFVIRYGNVLAAWSVTDCVIGDRAAIGIVTDERHRRRGLGTIAAAATADYWFSHGIRELDWLCVAANKGSQAIARKLGFTFAQEYPSYTGRPPYENDSDQTPQQWLEWAEYYREAYEKAPEKYKDVMNRCRRLSRDASVIALRREQRGKLALLFAGQQDGMTMLETYFQGYGGMGWVDRLDTPQVGLIRVGDFGFLAGDAASAGARTLVESLYKLAGYWIINPPDEVWTALIKAVWGEHAVFGKRYAIRHDTVFDRETLRRYAQTLPDGVHLEPMDEHWFEICRKDEVLTDFVSNFRDWFEFSSYARGVLAVKDGEVLGGASTYTRFDGVKGYRYGLELEVDTKTAYRRQGIATASAAQMILDCLEAGIYPAWDAASRASVALAEKLGYREKGCYPVVQLS